MLWGCKEGGENVSRITYCNLTLIGKHENNYACLFQFEGIFIMIHCSLFIETLGIIYQRFVLKSNKLDAWGTAVSNNGSLQN